MYLVFRETVDLLKYKGSKKDYPMSANLFSEFDEFSQQFISQLVKSASEEEFLLYFRRPEKAETHPTPKQPQE